MEVFPMRRIAGTILAAVMLLSGCAGSAETRQVRLTNTATTPAVPSDSSPETMPIRIAAASIVSPQETIRSYGLFFSYLEQKVGRPIELVQRKTYEETYELLRFGSLDMAMICTFIYVKGHNEIGLDLLAAPQVNGKAEYRSVIIVRADSKIEKFADLAGKRFAFTDPLSSSGRLYPLTLLKARGVEAGAFFSSTTYTYSHDNSVKAVVQGVVDGAAVDSMVFDQLVSKNPDLGLSLRVIERSAWMPSPPMIVSKRVDPALREAFRQALLTMHEDPEGKKILGDLGVEQFVLQQDEDYAPVRELARKAGMLP
jgi:phosphonate transport system substrate-binding protein